MMEHTETYYGPMRKTDLALLYSPHLPPPSARRKLNEWIALNKELSNTLALLGYLSKSPWLTAGQVRTIVGHLGEP